MLRFRQNQGDFIEEADVKSFNFQTISGSGSGDGIYDNPWNLMKFTTTAGNTSAKITVNDSVNYSGMYCRESGNNNHRTLATAITGKKSNYNQDGGGAVAAPFVVKTFELVSDPATDHLIAWGRANNTFVVFDPLAFSAFILPSRFKHNNFSSFIRQLNTYGFRKVDPDRWEFANEWFLRGQNHLLKNIVRRKHPASSTAPPPISPNRPQNHHHLHFGPLKTEEELVEGDQEEIRTEIERLKTEQSELEKEIEGMARRLEATERRPNQMLAFLERVVDDPEILPRLALVRENRRLLGGQSRVCSSRDESSNGEKRRKVVVTSVSSTSGSLSNNEGGGGTAEEEDESFGRITDEEVASTSVARRVLDENPMIGMDDDSYGVWWSSSGDYGFGDEGTVGVGFLGDIQTAAAAAGVETPNYPFCLFG